MKNNDKSRPNLRRFTFGLVINDYKHNKDTAKSLLGGGYNPDFGPDIHARELINYIFQDAIAQTIEMRMNFHVQHPDKDKWTDSDRRFLQHLKNKTRVYETIRDRGVKLLTSEPTEEIADTDITNGE